MTLWQRLWRPGKMNVHSKLFKILSWFNQKQATLNSKRKKKKQKKKELSAQAQDVMKKFVLF